ncbi:unnamed protein product [Didymodactylos carnosus]|uniref:BED-type domain-containing protein n=1 Tax=Didymodactylos carnosus TaxID=1234261 RepID=A0A816BI77_9BILA|nr:unnamed protein product [Didymodactylos carnosus]CAF4492012.1 unnamed protein product [Didymodactylos carnosus]
MKPAATVLKSRPKRVSKRRENDKTIGKDQSTTTTSAGSDHDDILEEKSRISANVWEHARKDGNDDELAICSICGKSISLSNKSTTTLRNHLIAVHGKTELKLENITKTKRTIPINKKHELDELCLKCIVQDGRAFGDLRKTGILKLFRAVMPGDFQNDFCDENMRPGLGF